MVKIKRSIFSKIFISIISASFVMGTFVLILDLREHSKDLEESLIRETKLLAQTMAESIEKGYLTEILPTEPLRETETFRDILFFWIVKPNGEVHLADNPEMIGKVIKDSSLSTEETIVKDSIFPEDGKKIKLIVHPLKMRTGEKSWSLFMGMSLERIAAVKRRVILIGFSLFIMVAVFVTFISFFLAKRVTNPLKRLGEGVRIIGKGDLDHRIRLKTNDEFEELGESFNRMAEDLGEYYGALEETKEVLEIRVKARTKELTEFTASLEDKVKERTKGLLKSREALLNMLGDVEEEREIAEEEKNKTLAIFTNFTDGLLVFDRENNLLLVNPQAEEFLGVKGGEVVDKSISELSKITVFKPLVKVLGKKIEGVFRKEFEVGEDLTLEVSTVPIIREKEKIGTLVILHNVTREKLIEKMKTEFVSLAAHQLRTPLSAIKWTLKMLLEGDLGEITKEQEEFIQGTYKSNERMIILINNLLNVTRIEEGRYLYNLVFTDIEGLVESIINSREEEVKKKRIKLILSRPVKKLPKTVLDVEKIKIAINNIFDNALRYTLPGGKVTISLKCGKKEIEFSIKDTGIGIPKKQQKRVFTKFFRGTNVVRMETEGTGLGLFITKNVIEAHGGKIWFDSKEGKGTTLYFTIPIRKRSSLR